MATYVTNGQWLGSNANTTVFESLRSVVQGVYSNGYYSNCEQTTTEANQEHTSIS